jgi:hypothetical protein
MEDNLSSLSDEAKDRAYASLLGMTLAEFYAEEQKMLMEHLLRFPDVVRAEVARLLVLRADHRANAADTASTAADCMSGVTCE